MRVIRLFSMLCMVSLVGALPLVAQDTTPPELGQLWLLGVGAAASFVLGILKFFSAKIAGLPDYLKTIVMFVITFVAGKIAVIIGVPIPAELSAAAATIVAALGGMGLRAILKAIGISAAIAKFSLGSAS